MRRFSDFRDEAILHDNGALKGKSMNTAGDTTIFSKARIAFAMAFILGIASTALASPAVPANAYGYVA